MVRKAVDRVLDSAVIVILALMAVIVAANVFCRFVLNFSIYWGDEIALVLMVWLTFLGAAIAVRDQSHYVFGYFLHTLTGPKRRAMLIVRDVLVLMAIGVLTFYSTEVTIQIRSWILPATEVSRAFLYAAAPVGCLFMLYYGADLLRQDLAAEPSDPAPPLGTSDVSATGTEVAE